MILVTGATGFVGDALVSRLFGDQDPPSVAVATRRLNHLWPAGVSVRIVTDLSSEADWHAALTGVTVVVHCAARVHVMQDTVSDPLKAYRETNVQGTLSFAKQAAQSGVRRFIFLSSIKVNGEKTQPGNPFRADDLPAPLDPYGISKLEAEIGLREICGQSGMELVIIRPPLVYGPGVKANFASMVRWVSRGVPLPLGAIHNLRSMVAIDNLVDLIVICINHSAAAGQVFLVSDGEDVSTTQLLERTAKALGVRLRLLPVPVKWLRWGAAAIGKTAVAHRLCDSLQVDIEKTKFLLGWQPPLTLDQGISKATQGILK